jgi:hypothetical protein
MTPETLINSLRRIGFGAAWFCAVLAFAVFVVLLLAEHDPLWQAAQAAMPLTSCALLGAFGAGMTRFLAR